MSDCEHKVPAKPQSTPFVPYVQIIIVDLPLESRAGDSYAYNSSDVYTRIDIHKRHDGCLPLLLLITYTARNQRMR